MALRLNFGAFGNGLIPALQAGQDRARQQATQGQAFKALQAMAAANGAGTIPGSTPMAAGGGGAPSMGGNPTGTAASPATPSPRSDMFALIDQVSRLDVPDDVKMAVLDKAGATMTPIEKYTQQLEMAQQKMNAQMQLLDERYKFITDIADKHNATSRANTEDRIGAQERGQDIRSSDSRYGTDTRASTSRRGQDIVSSDRQKATAERAREADQRDATSNRQISSKAVQHEEDLKVRQQNADTAADRAGTYKYGTMKSAADRQRLTDARVRSMASRVAPEDKKEFQAAKDVYDRAASLYQSLTRPGVTPPATQEDIAFAKQKMDAAQAKMEGLARKGGTATPVEITRDAPAAGGKEKIKPGEEVRYDEQGNAYVNRNGKAVPAEP